MQELSHIPELFIDLAVPRDIDPQVETLRDVEYYDIDQISQGSRDARQEEQLQQIGEIIADHTGVNPGTIVADIGSDISGGISSALDGFADWLGGIKV